MTRFAICSALYEAGRPFLGDWIAGIRAAAEGRDCRIIVAIDDLADATGALAPLADVAPVTAMQAPAGATPAAVRQVMLDAAAASDADLLVFCDMDDWLLEDALAQHETALSNADFSYGDVHMVNGTQAPGTHSFFHGAGIPERTTRGEQIADRNWLGFSNTAVRRDRLPSDATRIPPSVTAADWWFFAALLANGLKGRRTKAPVAVYRAHGGNLLGPSADPDTAAVRRRAEIMRQHYAARPQDPVAADRLPTLEAIIERLDAAPESLSDAIATACAGGGVWYEDIGRLVSGSRGGGKSANVALPDYATPAELATRSSLASDLARAGIEPGDLVMAHVSLRSLGFLVGGVRSALDALYDAVGPRGTLMMAAFTGELTDPSTWFKPPVPADWWDRIRAEMPPFDPAHTPASGVGVVAEAFRTEPGTLRSEHPVSSITARGPAAESVLNPHPLDQRFGPQSPIGRLAEMGGKVALVGAPYESVTLLHLTNYRLGAGERVTQRSPVLVGGEKRWLEYEDARFSWMWFPDAIAFLIAQGIASESRVGAARTLVMPAAQAVDAVTEWRRDNGIE